MTERDTVFAGWGFAGAGVSFLPSALLSNVVPLGREHVAVIWIVTYLIGFWVLHLTTKEQDQ